MLKENGGNPTIADKKKNEEIPSLINDRE